MNKSLSISLKYKQDFKTYAKEEELVQKSLLRACGYSKNAEKLDMEKVEKEIADLRKSSISRRKSQ
jgi:hypothetical protein